MKMSRPGKQLSIPGFLRHGVNPSDQSIRNRQTLCHLTVRHVSGNEVCLEDRFNQSPAVFQAGVAFLQPYGFLHHLVNRINPAYVLNPTARHKPLHVIDVTLKPVHNFHRDRAARRQDGENPEDLSFAFIDFRHVIKFSNMLLDGLLLMVMRTANFQFRVGKPSLLQFQPCSRQFLRVLVSRKGNQFNCQCVPANTLNDFPCNFLMQPFWITGIVQVEHIQTSLKGQK